MLPSLTLVTYWIFRRLTVLLLPLDNIKDTDIYRTDLQLHDTDADDGQIKTKYKSSQYLHNIYMITSKLFQLYESTEIE